jgi:hypothetical protein
MSVTILQKPKPYDFSGNLAMVEFQCTGFIDTEAVLSENGFNPASIAVNETITLKYGGKSVSMKAVLVPDDSGTQFRAGDSAENVYYYFRRNHQLSEDFDIEPYDNIVLFTAKVDGPEYDIAGRNLTPGVKKKYVDDYSVIVSIVCENAENTETETVYHQTIPLFDKVTGRVKVQTSDKIHDYISNDLRTMNPDIPSGTFVACKKSCRKFRIQYSELRKGAVSDMTQTEEFTVIHGSLSKIAQFSASLETVLQPSGNIHTDRFLKQGPRMVYTQPGQPQYLYFFNTRGTHANAELRVRLFFTDDSTQLVSLKKFEMLTLRKYAFNVTFDSFYSSSAYPGKTVSHYEVYLVNGSQHQISEIRAYYLDTRPKKHYRYFLSWSSFGSLDSRLCYGEGSTELQITQRLAESINWQNQDIRIGQSYAFNLKAQSRFSVSTGFMSKAELVLWRDFYLSLFKYRLVNGVLIPILLLSDTIAEIQDGSLLHAQAFEYRYLYEEHAYTEGDIEDAGRYYKDILFYNQTPPDNALITEEGNVLMTEAKYFME